MAKREIRIYLTIPGEPGDTAQDIRRRRKRRVRELFQRARDWMNMKAMAEPDRFDYEIAHDHQRSDLGQQMNDRWDVYGKETRWS
ncbi:hypothetical protein [Rhodococcus sp. USK13]|uniref:hypothetical protein n=1 Tax=Rhodococcus sp. USK13 TaxID=2806442 RepID=UPI001BCFDACB|nr:hypothetical protein [Rhodococcus sp. USK13]